MSEAALGPRGEPHVQSDTEREALLDAMLGSDPEVEARAVSEYRG